MWSYACISLSTLVSAPPVRRWLIGLNEGAPVHRRWVPSMLLLNSTLLLVCVCATVGTIPPAIMLGQAFSEVHGVYDQASTALETAKSKGDLEIFNNLGGYLLEFGRSKSLKFPVLRPAERSTQLSPDRSSNKNGNATKMGHSIYLSYVIFFFVTGILPAVFLHREINRKINRLENDQSEWDASLSVLVSMAVSLTLLLLLFACRPISQLNVTLRRCTHHATPSQCGQQSVHYDDQAQGHVTDNCRART